MRLIGEKVDLRPIQEEDLPELIRWGQNRQLQYLMDGEYPQDLGEAHRWLREARADRGTKLLAIVTKDDRLIGEIELVHISWRRRECELRIRIGKEEDRNQGHGTDAIMTMLLYAFSSLHLERVYLRVYSFNKRAIRCYTKCGFRKEGRLRRPNDREHEIILMEVLRSECLPSRSTSPAV
ncbi:MAG: GNAT family N-acetyltransferase [Firmicutes bacterium]|jgi:RimJ/RimL family protein N-acetyltransferase|nr:GNAT family N-acetyltransferase [Bacillota bacterium]